MSKLLIEEADLNTAITLMYQATKEPNGVARKALFESLERFLRKAAEPDMELTVEMPPMGFFERKLPEYDDPACEPQRPEKSKGERLADLIKMTETSQTAEELKEALSKNCDKLYPWDDDDFAPWSTNVGFRNWHNGTLTGESQLDMQQILKGMKHYGIHWTKLIGEMALSMYRSSASFDQIHKRITQSRLKAGDTKKAGRPATNKPASTENPDWGKFA